VRYDVIALGETMACYLPPAGVPLAEATTLVATHGGAESNACIGLSRLGLRVAWVSRLGADPPGEAIAAALRREGVDLRFVVRDPERPTGLMLRDPVRAGVHYYRAGSAASRLRPSDLRGVPVAQSRAVLVTGVTALVSRSAQRAAIALLERARGLRVVDPNLRPNVWGSDRAAELVLPLLERADVVLGGELELARLVGGEGVAEVALRCRALGPSEVVVKRGARGAVAFGDEGMVEHAPPPGPDVDTVGAGDAFNAGYLAARLDGATIGQALEDGARCGAAVAGSLGDTQGFPISLRRR
jgi:2-dehydro-3-deoxygluconokinase